jgi:ABC-type amino acid transport substrate-binding protein
MKKSLIFLTMVFMLLSSCIGFAEEKPLGDLVATIAGPFPGLSDSPEKGEFISLVKAIDELYTGGKIKIGVYPFERSFNNVIEGKADLHIPNLRNPAVDSSKFPFAFVTEPIGPVSLVIYSHKDKVITRKMIDDAVKKGGKFPYVIELAGGMQDNFSFPNVATNDAAQSLQKIQNKRVDAFIWAQEDADFNLKSLKLNAVHREFYEDFDDVITIPKGPKAAQLDKLLSDILKKLKASGRLPKEVYVKVHLPYDNWQPVKMGW